MEVIVSPYSTSIRDEFLVLNSNKNMIGTIVKTSNIDSVYWYTSRDTKIRERSKAKFYKSIDEVLRDII